MKLSISIISLGPGSADLITLRGLRELEQADVIFSPSTKLRDGSESSRAFDIMQELGIPSTKIKLYHLPMSKDRTLALGAYAAVAREAAELTKQGKKVVVTAEGDAGFYSSSHYIIEALRGYDIQTEKVPGVPAFIACGAHAQMHVVMQEESLVVVAKSMTTEDLEAHLNTNEVVVIMKASLCAQAIKNVMDTNQKVTFHYFENIGYHNEFYTTDKETILDRKFPYFSLLIIKRDAE